MMSRASQRPSLPAQPTPRPVPWPPIDPGPSPVQFPDPPVEEANADWVVGLTRTLDPAMVLQAYRQGIFPWPTSRSELIPWASPEPRMVFPLEKADRWPRTVRRDLARAEGEWQVTFDDAFSDVMRACAFRPGEGTWITRPLYLTYCALHGLGWGHSVEVWRPGADGTRALVGGLYGLAIGGLFAGESMFHLESGASKVAFARMAEHLRARGFTLFDVQAHSDHLASLGCTEIPRREYLSRLRLAIQEPARFSP
jgi:leucyl/phenylalanyl-tRNA--protein transferase